MGITSGDKVHITSPLNIQPDLTEGVCSGAFVLNSGLRWHSLCQLFERAVFHQHYNFDKVSEQP